MRLMSMNVSEGRPDARWDPTLYLQFSDLRLRPAVELLQRVPLDAPQTVYDIGCGPGHVTRALQEKWPHASVCGVDSSPEMLAAAAGESGAIRWEQADIQHWTPQAHADLIFASAVLHFLGDHETLLPRLLGFLRPGGCLALHMPDWCETPWYGLMREVLATAGPGGSVLGTPMLRGELARNHVQPAAFYYQLLVDRTAHLDIWKTDYLQVVEGDDPVYDWIKASGLRAVTDHLDDSERGRFLAQYVPRLRKLYPNGPDGRTLFPFRRLFVVAQVH